MALTELQLRTLVNLSLPDNSQQLITPQKVRDVFGEIITNIFDFSARDITPVAPVTFNATLKQIGMYKASAAQDGYLDKSDFASFALRTYLDRYDTSDDFPATGDVNTFYLDKSDTSLWLWTGSTYEKVSGAGGGGSIITSSDDVPEGTTNLYYTSARQAAVTSALNLKVNIADIVDNLTSTDADKPLSANQGYLLNNKFADYVLVGGTYANPAFITAIAWSKITGVPDFALTDDVDANYVRNDGTYTDPAWIFSLAWSKITGVPTFELQSNKNANNGYAGLDSGGKIPASLLPSTVMTLQGNWNAATNTPTLADGTGDVGDVYECTMAGTVTFGTGNTYTFAVGDWAVYGANGKWYKSLNSNEVTSVNGQTGTVVLNTSHISESSNLYFTTDRVLATALTGFAPVSGNITGSDTVLQAFGKTQDFINNIAATVRAITLSGYTLGSNAALTATDTILEAFGKLQAQINAKQNALTFDSSPTASSTNPVTSGGVKTALDGKQDASNKATSSDITTGSDDAKYLTALGLENSKYRIKRTTVGDANYSILATDKVVVTSAAFTAARTWTLPAANSVPAGYEIIVADEFGAVTSTNTLTIQRVGSDTINGSTTEVMRGAYGWRRFISNGSNRWTLDAGQVRIAGNTALTGTGNALLQVDTIGAVSRGSQTLDRIVIDTDITDAIALATFNQNNNYTSSITPANSKIMYAGQVYYNNNFKYEAIYNNIIFRTAAVIDEAYTLVTDAANYVATTAGTFELSSLASAASRTFQMPNPINFKGVTLRIINLNAHATNLWSFSATYQPLTAAGASVTLSNQTAYSFLSNGSNWYRIS